MSQNLIPFLGKRFLLSKSSDGFLSFIAWVSVVGVSLGVLALVVVTSVINGFQGDLVKLITEMNGDVILYTRGEPISSPDKVIDKVRRGVPEVISVTPAFVAELMVSGKNGVAGAALEGVDFSTVRNVTALMSHIERGRAPERDDEVMLGTALAEKLGLTIGDDVRLIAPFKGDGGGPDAASAPKVWPAVVSGLVRMGNYEYDAKFLYGKLSSVQNFLEVPGQVTAFKIKLASGANSRRASDQLSESFGYPFRAKDWAQLNGNLLYAIELEKVVITIILTIIVLVSAFNVVSTLMMMIHDKTKEIAILKAMGFMPRQSFILFATIGTGIGAVGVGLGVLLGVGLNSLLSDSRLIRLPADVYNLDYLPVVTRWPEILVIALVALGVTFLATLYPARQVAMRSPSEGLRHEG